MIRRKKGIIVDNKWINIAIVVFSFIYVGIISYFVTDINIGFIYTYLSFVLYYVIMYINNIGKNTFLNSIILIISIPITIVLLLKSSDYFLINASYILLLILLPSLVILFNQAELKHCILKYISTAIGIGITIFIIWGPRNIIKINNNYIQEVVAEEYLINQLHMEPIQISCDRDIRGKATEVRAWSSGDLKIIMIYRNGKIESYKLVEL
jgi:hypothetical protein